LAAEEEDHTHLQLQLMEVVEAALVHGQPHQQEVAEQPGLQDKVMMVVALALLQALRHMQALAAVAQAE
jgi:hypothetical protein